jgi:hypothetical protein
MPVVGLIQYKNPVIDCNGYAFASISFSTTSPQFGYYLIPSSLPVLASTLRRLLYYLYIPDVLDVALVPRLITHPFIPLHIRSISIPLLSLSYLYTQHVRRNTSVNRLLTPVTFVRISISRVPGSSRLLPVTVIRTASESEIKDCREMLRPM